MLGAAVSHRPTFLGIENADISELQRALRHFGPVDLVYLRCHLDGTLFTQNARARFQQDVTSTCPWCSARDGFHHRAWVCPHFTSCRAHLTPAQWAVLPSLPACLLDHGWPVLLPEWEVFVRLLLRDDGFCRMSPAGPPPLDGGACYELFVDGTCAYPTEVKLRYAAWVVTVATGVGEWDNRVLMGGHVHGLCQSPYRAELQAVLAACRWASQRQCQVRIWCDCQGVVRKVRRLLQGARVKPNVVHSDLWTQLAAVLAASPGLVTMMKVVSHGSQRSATTPLEEWAYWHNNLADLAADSINQRRSDDFWGAWQSLHKALEFHRNLHLAILRTLLQTSRVAAAQTRPQAPVPEALSVVVQPSVPSQWSIPSHQVKRYGQVNLDMVHAWWQACGVGMLQGSGTLQFIAGIQLFYSFNMYTG